MLQFEFNGHTSDEYGLIITQIEENDNLANRSLQLGAKNKYRPRENHFGVLYEDNYSFVIGVMKNPCKNKSVDSIASNDSGYLTSNDIKTINAWLTSPQYPKLLKFINNDYFEEEIEFFATITTISTEHTSLPYELTYTVTCDSPWGYTPLITHEVTSSSTLTKKYTITNNSDCWEDYVYPTIKVSPKSHGTITIKNITDNNRIMTINALKNDVFYIDCRNLKIYDITNSIVSFEDLGVEDIDDIYWPRLAYGENIFEFSGDATFEISYREPRKVGAFA